jgi:hypothetical protein
MAFSEIDFLILFDSSASKYSPPPIDFTVIMRDGEILSGNLDVEAVNRSKALANDD